MKTYVIPDLHGELHALNEILLQIKYKTNEMKLIFLGDYVDTGKESKEVIDNVIKLQREANEGNVTTLLGNHDEAFKDFLLGTIESKEFDGWYNNYGGYNTLQSYWKNFEHTTDINGIRNFILKNHGGHLEWLNSLKHYHQDNHFYYAHAGCDFLNPNIEEHHKDTLVLTDRDRFFKVKSPLDRTIVVGHSVVDNIVGHEKREPFINLELKKIGIDGGYIYDKDLYTMEIKENGEFIVLHIDGRNRTHLKGF